MTTSTVTTTTLRRTARWLVPALAAAGVATATTLAATAPSAGAAAPTSSPDRTITLQGSGLALPYDGLIDVNGDGPGAGDEMLVADALSNRAGHHVGMARGVCTIIHGSEHSKNVETDCVGTALLKGEGQITFQGIEHLTKGNTVICAVTGGTGEFLGAAGWVHITLHGKANRTTYTFHLRG